MLVHTASDDAAELLAARPTLTRRCHGEVRELAVAVGWGEGALHAGGVDSGGPPTSRRRTP